MSLSGKPFPRGDGSRLSVAQGLRRDRAYYGRRRLVSMLDLRPLFIVVADVPNYGSAQYCLPTDRQEAELVVEELRASAMACWISSGSFSATSTARSTVRLDFPVLAAVSWVNETKTSDCRFGFPRAPFSPPPTFVSGCNAS